MAAEFIKNLQPLFLISNKSDIAKLRKVSGHGGHVDPDHFGEFVDAMPAFGKCLNDRQARRVGQCLEYLGTFP